jgi:hypothetical protein
MSPISVPKYSIPHPKIHNSTTVFCRYMSLSINKDDNGRRPSRRSTVFEAIATFIGLPYPALDSASDKSFIRKEIITNKKVHVMSEN